MKELIRHTDHINELLARYGVKFGIYKNNTFKEQLFPFDAIPRVIQHKEFEYLEKGLKQRVLALNLFLKDIYSKKQIIKDGVIPEEFIFISSGYLAQCEGTIPPKGIYSHISGIDLVKGKDEEWYILEDNLRVPSGVGQAVLAVMNFLSAQGIIRYQVPVLTESKVITDTELVSVRTSESGVFEPLVKAGEDVRVGQPLANIIHPYESELIETLYAPVDGRIFFIHNDPLTYANTAVIKIVR